MGREWVVASQGKDVVREEIEPYALMDLVDGVSGMDAAGLMGVGLSKAEIVNLVRTRALPVSMGEKGQYWQLGFMKEYGAMQMNWNLVTEVDGECGTRVTARLEGYLYSEDGSLTTDIRRGELGIIARVEVGMGGQILRGSIGFGTGNMSRDFVSLNYLSNFCPERVLLCRGGVGGYRFDSAARAEEFANQKIKLGGRFYPAHPLVEVSFADACGLITQVVENSLIESPADMEMVLSDWMGRF